MPTELTESQKIEITLTSEDFSITQMAEKYAPCTYITIYNFLKSNKLKYRLTKPQRVKIDPKDIVPYAELLKERAAVTPDPKRKWERPKAEYSNQQYDDLINKILGE